MKSISVDLPKIYNINIEVGLRLNFLEKFKLIDKKQKIVILSQKLIFDIYGYEIIKQFKEHKIDVESILLENSEDAKSLSKLNKIYKQLVEFNCDRDSVLIALGGGVVGDISGFIAGTFLRGIEYIQIPTTLLSMVDSSIGGKTGVNLDSGKNLIGLIWQPRSVIIDPEFLKSLPKREIISALSEIIKYGLILDRNFFNYLREHISLLLSAENLNVLSEIIHKCGTYKVDIIEKDEKEIGIRKILNFGHTIGHALEKFYGYETLRHGEAIAYGILASSFLSVKYSSLSKQDQNLIHELIMKLPLPKLPQMDIEKVISLIRNDKKVKLGKINFILLSDIGKAEISNSVSIESIKEVLNLL